MHHEHRDQGPNDRRRSPIPTDEEAARMRNYVPQRGLHRQAEEAGQGGQQRAGGDPIHYEETDMSGDEWERRRRRTGQKR